MGKLEGRLEMSARFRGSKLKIVSDAFIKLL
jgi:hypothetical protein